MNNIYKFSFFGFIFLVLFPVLLLSNELKWETLKTLTFDEKTKKTVIPPDLKKAIQKDVTIQGFMMPLDYESKEIAEFLLMPYIPSCMHIPPPPPSQLIHVKMKKNSKVSPSFEPIEVTGKLTIQANKELESSYQMEGKLVKKLGQFKPNTTSPSSPIHP